MRPITKDRALEQCEAILHAAQRRDYSTIRFFQMREIREILDRVGEVRQDIKGMESAKEEAKGLREELQELQQEMNRLRRNLGQLGSHDPD